jgi:hypothetical protein
VTPRGFAATEGEAYQPKREQDDRNDPEEMKGEAQSGEQKHNEKCQQNDHETPLRVEPRLRYTRGLEGVTVPVRLTPFSYCGLLAAAVMVL